MAKKRSARKGDAKVHLLDVGETQYGDCVVCEMGGETVLIDGGHLEDFDGSEGHTSIPDQLLALLGSDETVRVSLLVVSHAHADHIGCLPEMVGAGIVTAEWALLTDPDLAWPGEVSDSPSAADRLLAALREEPRLDLETADAYEVFAADAASQQPRYRAMIRRLKRDGTRVVLHGKSPLTKLHERFKNIGLQVLGPSKAHLKACASIMEGVAVDFIRDATHALAVDAEPSTIYRQLVGAWEQTREVEDAGDASDETDAADALKRVGPLVNLQSSAIVLDDGNHRFLFSGDLQIEKPEVANSVIKESMVQMLEDVAELGPYDFVKVGHHGSYNAFGDRLMASLGEETRNFGICTGSASASHPSRKAIDLLRARSEEITWARTDRNGAVTFNFGITGATVSPERGRLNDTTPPSSDEIELPVAAAGPAAAIASTQPVVTMTAGTHGQTMPIEIRIPYVAGSNIEVTLSVKVGQGLTEQVPRIIGGASESTIDPSRFKLAAGRELPKLLFLTNSAKLKENVGSDATDIVLAEILRNGHALVDIAQAQGDPLTVARAQTHAYLRQDLEIKGVVIVGGHDVIPSERRDVAPGASEEDREADQADRLVVWSDATFADHDDDGLQELPVSRVPDGRSSGLLLKALSAPKPALSSRHGVRNSARPFADLVYANLKGTVPMLQSHPHDRSVPDYRVGGDHVYLMLHGDYGDATKYWGERPDGTLVEALDIDQLQLEAGSVVFTGCCWAALSVEEPAGTLETQSPTPRLPENSIALRALSQGALAFVGCTGMHYSPVEASIDRASAPLHDGFWRHVLAGRSPAEALFEAKKAFIADPGRAETPRARKIFEQFTVLGLGW